MNEWINVKDSIPSPFQVVWIYWRDREVVLGCRIVELAEGDNPSEEWYSFDHEMCRWTHWWQPVSSSNWDKPKKPQI